MRSEFANSIRGVWGRRGGGEDLARRREAASAVGVNSGERFREHERKREREKGLARFLTPRRSFGVAVTS
jgi:hypothetical protein